MRLFGKKKLSETEAAGQFVLMVMNGVKQQWSTIASELKAIAQTEDSISDDRYAGFEFALAVVAIQVYALPKLLPSEQASRIKEHVVRCISSPDLGAYPREALEEYQRAWDKALHRSEPPFYGIASVLFDKLGCRSSVRLGNARFKDPLLLDALSEKIVTFGGPWWKAVTQEYKLMP